MAPPPSGLERELRFARDTYGIGGLTSWTIMVVPCAIMVAFAILLGNPSTWRLGLWLVLEDHPVEWLTFYSAFAGGIYGLLLMRRARKWEVPRLTRRLYTLGSLGLLLFAMEEISWGQRLFRFHTPKELEVFNQQGEFNLHNVAFIESTEKFLLVGCSLAGFLLARTSWRSDPLRLRPPGVLAPLFISIFIPMALELTSFYVPMNPRFANVLYALVEVAEMLVGFAGLVYLVLNGRALERASVAPASERPAVASGPS